MKKINFKHFKLFVDVAKTRATYTDVSKNLSDGIYQNGQGIEALNLALKIYNATGDEEYNERECAFLRAYAQQFGTAMFLQSLTESLSSSDEDDSASEK